MGMNDLFNEKKQSPAGGPACWKGKKIGNPKTKMKGGKRVNNCIDAGTNEEAELDEAAVCPQCGDPNCTCEPGTCDCEPIEESALELSELRQLAGLGESYATAPYGDQEDTMVNYSKTKRMGDASVTVSANAKSMEELHQVLALAGLDPNAADKYAEPEEPCGCDDAEPEAEQPGPSTLNYRYETDKEKLIDIIKQRLQQKLS